MLLVISLARLKFWPWFNFFTALHINTSVFENDKYSLLLMCKAVKKLNQGQNFKRANEMTNNITLFTLQCKNSQNISNFTQSSSAVKKVIIWKIRN